MVHPNPDDLKKLRISASGLDKFNSCPRRWAYYYLEERPDQAGAPALIGSYVHEILEDFFKLKKKERTEGSVKEIAADQWDDFQAGYEKQLTDSTELTELEIYQIKTESWESLSKLWLVEDPVDVNVHSTEMRLEVTYDDIPFLGFVDRLDYADDGSLTVIDYKTGKVPLPKYTPTKLMQLLLYAWALEELGIESTQAKLYFLKGGTTIGIDVDSKSMKEVRKYLKKTVGKIHEAFEEGFHPKTQPLCGWCPYVVFCPEGEEFVHKMRSFGRMRKDAPAFELLAEKGRDGEPLSPDETQALFDL